MRGFSRAVVVLFSAYLSIVSFFCAADAALNFKASNGESTAFFFFGASFVVSVLILYFSLTVRFRGKKSIYIAWVDAKHMEIRNG